MIDERGLVGDDNSESVKASRATPSADNKGHTADNFSEHDIASCDYSHPNRRSHDCYQCHAAKNPMLLCDNSTITEQKICCGNECDCWQAKLHPERAELTLTT